MKTMSVAAVALSACLGGAGGAAAQDPQDLANGQRYLEQIAAAWSKQLPQERLAGAFMGRQWLGHVRIRVAAAPAGSGAVFEVTSTGELSLMGETMVETERVLLTRSLLPVSVDATSTESGKKKQKTLRVEKGRWKLVVDTDGTRTEADGELKPGTTWNVQMLPLFARPLKTPLALNDLEEGRARRLVLRALPERRKAQVDGKPAALDALEMRADAEEPDYWTFLPDGRAHELTASAAPVSLRPIAESAIGKNLPGELEVHPAARALIDIFVAMRQRNRDAALAGFDLAHMAADQVTGFDKMSPAQRQKAIADVRTELEGKLLAEDAVKGLPPPPLLQEVLASGMKTSVDKGVARVEAFGSHAWMLHEADIGGSGRRWLVFKVDPIAK
jgi:hypothetical protein